VHETRSAHAVGSAAGPRRTTRPRQPVAGQSAGRERDRGLQSRYSLIVEMGRREKLTIRQIIGRLGGGRGISRSPAHPNRSPTRSKSGLRTGPPTDSISCRHCCRPVSNCSSSTCADSPARGLFRHEYTGRTLRDHYGLPRPLNQHSRDSAKVSRYESFLRVRTRRHLNGPVPGPFDGRASTKHQWFYDKPRVHRSVCREKAQQIAGPK